MELIGKLPLNYLNDCKKLRSYMSYPKVYINKGNKCAICDKVATSIGVFMDCLEGSISLRFIGDNFILNIDHIYPKSEGGTDHISNLQPTCEGCNTLKSNKIQKPIKEIKKFKIREDILEDTDVKLIKISNDSDFNGKLYNILRKYKIVEMDITNNLGELNNLYVKIDEEKLICLNQC
jgi:hypothetical protein